MDVVLSRKEVSIERIDEKTEGGTHWVIPVVFLWNERKDKKPCYTKEVKDNKTTCTV